MKVGRNDPCHCGSGKKYKHCCYAKDSEKSEVAVLEPEPADQADEEASEEHEDAADRKERAREQRHGRQRFEGHARGGKSTFNPRTTRGAQRGH